MKALLVTVSLIALSALAQPAFAACEKVEGGAKSAFDGSSIAGFQVEKASLVPLNKEFPALNVVEKAFKGEVSTCTSCTDKYITCK